MHDLLFAHQTHLKPKDLHGYAQQLDLDMARFTAEMDDHVYLQRVREHLQSGADSGVRSTPTFFVNGRIEDVSFGLRALFEAVEARLHPAPGK
jgi:protein-disulfide isomerase